MDSSSVTKQTALDGLIRFVETTKPYHTQILDVELEYTYTERMTVQLQEQSFNLDIEMMGNNLPLQYECNDGYGILWDGTTDVELVPSTSIISASAPESIAVAPTAFVGSPSTTQQLLITNNPTPNPLPIGTQITFSTTGTFPITEPQIQTGIPYTVTVSSVSNTPSDYIEVSIDNQTVVWHDDAYSGTLTITPIDLTINSFLIDSVVGTTYQFTANTVNNVITLTTPKPMWPNGTKVEVWSSGTLPAPLLPNTDYYVQQVLSTNSFRLSTVRYPQHEWQYISLEDVGTGTLNIRRTETFYNGQTLTVTGSFNNYNDSTYNVLRIVRESSTTERVYVLGRIIHKTPGSLLSDGIIEGAQLGYSETRYCPPTQMSNSHVEALMVESLLIEIDEEEDFIMYIGGEFDVLPP